MASAEWRTAGHLRVQVSATEEERLRRGTFLSTLEERLLGRKFELKLNSHVLCAVTVIITEALRVRLEL